MRTTNVKMGQGDKLIKETQWACDFKTLEVCQQYFY